MNHKLNNFQQNWALLKVFAKEHSIYETKRDLSVRLCFTLDVKKNLVEPTWVPTTCKAAEHFRGERL